MALIAHHKRFGNLKVLDIRTLVNVHQLKPDFNMLTTDRYIKDGYRKKHISRFRIKETDYVLMKHEPLFQTSKTNPIHGNIERHYPRIHCNHPASLRRILDIFKENANLQDGDTILVQFQRIICNDNLVGLPSVEGYHPDGVNHIGLVCVDRDNIKGGLNEFCNANNIDDDMKLELSPGYMVVFEDKDVYHRVTPIVPLNCGDVYGGHRDVILLGTPAFESSY